jgi:IS5 family transposase
LRWKFAAGGLDFDHPGFVHTVLVDMRARLRASEHPNRIFEAILEVAKSAGLVGRKRVLDSTPLYDAVATQDTVTLIRSAIRGLLRIVDAEHARELRKHCKRDDDYVTAGKPLCDWDDAFAREALIDALARDAYAILAALDGRTLAADVKEAAALLATVVGQDLEKREDGLFRIAHRVAPNRVISTVDPETRHGHKTSARGFDGYKGHIAIDPETEIITSTQVTPGNTADGLVAEALLNDILCDGAIGAAVYGDSAYGTADIVEKLEAAGIEANVKVQPPPAPPNRFGKADFNIDLVAQTVTCPQGNLVHIRKSANGGGVAHFASSCVDCPLRAKCTDSKTGRDVTIHPKEATLKRSRARQSSSSWKEQYRSTRPKVERKLAHLMFRRHGGRRARVLGRLKVGLDFAMLAAATNLSRLASLGLQFAGNAWAC